MPDVRNDALTVAIVSLVIGLASTAASILLAPKPRDFGSDRRGIQRRQLGGRTGSDVFTPNFGFDTVQELANYGNTVPVVFTRRDESNSEFGSGGVLISPQAVWSRMKSWGSYQVFELACIAGQARMRRPDLAGIFLGNNALDGIYQEYFDFYWNGGSETAGPGSRLRAYNLTYGNLLIDGNSDNPGISGSDQAFYAPTREGSQQPAFSGAFTPTSQTRFGVYQGIPNGTPFRPDWKVISIPDQLDEEQRRQRKNQQKKYVDEYLMDTHPYGNSSADVGANATGCGMPGTGTNFARRIGVVEHISTTGTRTVAGEQAGDNIIRDRSVNFRESWQNLRKEVIAEKGDFITVLYGKGEQTVRPFPVSGIDDLNVSDIRSAIEGEVQRYDQMLSQGATFMIGRTTWQVVERPNRAYDPARDAGDGFRVKLRCLETWSQVQNKIGIVAEEAITYPTHVPYTQLGDEIDENWYPLLKYEIGNVQNTRACDVTEICIKSRVWAKFNGITNFNTIYRPVDMYNANEQDISLNEGKLTAFAKRLSLFFLDARPSNYDSNATDNEGWTWIGPYKFGVVGNAPIDIYSFIRITHPERQQLEFRLRPCNSPIPTIQSGGAEDIFVLDGARVGASSWSWDSYMGRFNIQARGEFSQPRKYFTHTEMAVVPDLITDEEGNIDIVYGGFVPDPDSIKAELLSVTVKEPGENYPNVGDPIRPNTLSNIMSIFSGVDPYDDNRSPGSRLTFDNWIFDRNLPTRAVYMELTLEAYRDTSFNPNKDIWWKIVNTKVLSTVGTFNPGDTFVKNARNANGVQFGFRYEVQLDLVFDPNARPRTATRLFQKYSGVAEVSHYGDLISRSCDDAPEHEVIAVNECLSESQVPDYDKCSVVGLKLKSSDNFTQVDQLRLYMKEGLEVERLVDGDIAPSNLLSDLLWYLATDKDTGAGNIIDPALVDREGLITTGRYLRANKLFFDDALAEPVNLRGWLSQVATSVLCYMTLKNGRLGLEPALPYHPDGTIDATQPLTISGMFSDGNIIEDSLRINWLELEERQLFQASITYRISRLNQIPEQRTITVRYADANEADVDVEQFELNHITTTEHALKVARYYLAVRKHQTHTITFSTMPWGLDLAPGQYIRVASELSPYNPANNGIIDTSGNIVSVTQLADGDYPVYYWDRSSENTAEGSLVVVNGKATDLFNTVFSLKGSADDFQVYQIETITLNEEGIVEITASNFPVDSDERSLIARDVMDLDNNFVVEGTELD